jgi:OOP family OmpA-OmpF porin
MKKSFMVFAFLATFLTVAMADTNELKSTNAADLSHWSLGVKGGTNYYDIFDNPMMRDDQWHLIAGAVLEYTLTPKFGIGAEYEYNPYCAAILHNGTDLITPHAEAVTHDASLFASFNLSNIIKPVREGIWKNTNVYANLGGGAGFYNFDTGGKTNLLGSGISPLAYAGLNAEYNISKALAVGLEGQYRYYFDKAMGGIYSQADPNQGGTLSLGLRYKFGANKKQHVRNAAEPVKISVADVKTETKPEPIIEIKPKVEPAPVAPKPEVKPEPKKEEPVINFTFENIQFKFDSDQLTQPSVVIVDNLVNTLTKYNEYWKSLKINGHTDSMGDATYNKNLSQRRVDTVKKYIVGKGISESRITSQGYGEEQPKATNDTKEGRQINRRVEFEVSK